MNTPQIDEAAKYNRRECFADSLDGLEAFIAFDELLKKIGGKDEV